MIISIAGVKRSGKDTIAKRIAESWRTVDTVDTELCNELSLSPLTCMKPFHIYHFADPFKRALEGIYGWDKDIWNSSKKEMVDPFWGISPRAAAQVFGTEWSILLSNKSAEYAEKTGRRTYLKVFQRLFEEDPTKNYVIPDMRFKYESDAIHEMGGYRLRVRREAVETKTDPHPSEQEILTLDVDCEVRNDSTILELYDIVDLVANSLSLAKIKG